MKRLSVFTTIFVFALCASAFAQDIQKTIHDLETQSREAALKADASFLESHLTSDFIRVFPDGSMTDRQEMIDRAKSGGLKYSSIDVKDEKIRAYGDNTAVVVATSSVKGTRDGKPLDGDYRSTRVWVKDGGQWKLASFQSTKIAPM